MNGYDFHPEAAIDLDEIWDFIAEKNLDAADKVIATILAMNWCHFRIKASSPDLPSRPLRFIVVREYLIAYTPDERALWVIAVMHGRRSPRVMAAILRDRERCRISTMGVSRPDAIEPESKRLAGRDRTELAQSPFGSLGAT